MRKAGRTGAALAGLAVVAGAAFGIPHLLGKEGRTSAEQRLGAEPGTGASPPPTARATRSAPAAPATAVPGGPKPFTLVGTGDIIPYPSIVQRAADDSTERGGYDFRKMF